jgi:hypothetical protein
MRMLSRDERMAPGCYQAARSQLHCPALYTPMRQLILEQATSMPTGGPGGTRMAM